MRAFVLSLVIGSVALVAAGGAEAPPYEPGGAEARPYAQAASVRGAGSDVVRGAGSLDPAVRAVNNRFAGVWKLVAEETRSPSG